MLPTHPPDSVGEEAPSPGAAPRSPGGGSAPCVPVGPAPPAPQWGPSPPGVRCPLRGLRPPCLLRRLPTCLPDSVGDERLSSARGFAPDLGGGSATPMTPAVLAHLPARGSVGDRGTVAQCSAPNPRRGSAPFAPVGPAPPAESLAPCGVPRPLRGPSPLAGCASVVPAAGARPPVGSTRWLMRGCPRPRASPRSRRGPPRTGRAAPCGDCAPCTPMRCLLTRPPGSVGDQPPPPPPGARPDSEPPAPLRSPGGDSAPCVGPAPLAMASSPALAPHPRRRFRPLRWPRTPRRGLSGRPSLSRREWREPAPRESGGGLLRPRGGTAMQHREGYRGVGQPKRPEM